MKSRARGLIIIVLAGLAAGCMVARQPAPVVQRAPEPVRTPGVQGADTYVVKRGDTLYAIAAAHGVDYRDLARWNNITNPAAIEVGQVLRTKDPNAVAAPPPAAPVEPAPGTAVASPYQAPPPVQGRPMGSEGAALPPAPAKREPAPDAAEGVVTTPQAVKLPYSQAALARLQESAGDAGSAAAAAPSAPAASSPSSSQAATPPAPAAQAPSAPAERSESAAAADDPDAVNWGWPTKGRVIAGFNENGGPKGVQIAGNLGQAIVASAPGRVVYTGSGLRGYGNLVIIKHNNTYLSAYAHNRTVLVKQGDNVTRGQKIAEMGDSDASRVMLHFEIRRLGKPVDPMKYLPPG